MLALEDGGLFLFPCLKNTDMLTSYKQYQQFSGLWQYSSSVERAGMETRME